VALVAVSPCLRGSCLWRPRFRRPVVLRWQPHADNSEAEAGQPQEAASNQATRPGACHPTHTTIRVTRQAMSGRSAVRGATGCCWLESSSSRAAAVKF
jgi:hypothetical protein